MFEYIVLFFAHKVVIIRREIYFVKNILLKGRVCINLNFNGKEKERKEEVESKEAPSLVCWKMSR